jgi:hypothetical protein
MRRRSHAVGHVEHDAQLFCEFGPPVGHSPVQVDTRAAHQRRDHAGDPLGLARDSRFVVVLNALWLSQYNGTRDLQEGSDGHGQESDGVFRR